MFLIFLVLAGLLSGCAAAVLVPAAPAVPAISLAVSPIILPATALAIVVGALNVSSAPPPNPCDLAEIAWQLLSAATGRDLVYHPYGTPQFIEIEREAFDAGKGLGIGADSMGQSHSVTFQKLIEWLKLCPADFKVETTLDGWQTIRDLRYLRGH